MSTTTIYRLSSIVLAAGGLISIAAFVLDLVVDVLHPHIEDDTLLAAMTPAWVIHTVLLFVGALLIVLALPGLYAWLREKTGILGLIAFILTLLGLMMGDLMGAAISAFALPPLTASAAGRAILHANPPYPGIVSVQFQEGVRFMHLPVDPCTRGRQSRTSGRPLALRSGRQFWIIRGTWMLLVGAASGLFLVGLPTDRLLRARQIPHPIPGFPYPL